jgi:hypothetical protein
MGESTGEMAAFAVMVSRAAMLDVQGYVLPAASVQGAEQRDLLSTKWWIAHPHCVRLGLGDLFDTSRHRLAEHYGREALREMLPADVEWVESRGEMLAVVASLNGSLGPQLGPMVRLALSAQWDRAISRLKPGRDPHAVYSRLLDIWKRARRLGVDIDHTHSVTLLDAVLAAELAAFSRTLDVSSCERMRGLLTIVDSFSIPVAKSRLEDAFNEVYTGAFRDLYAAYCADHDRAKRALILTILTFARRMNFCTDEFRLEQTRGRG